MISIRAGKQHVVQATRPIRIVDVEAEISGPENAVGGSTIEVAWSGPKDEMTDDFISIVEPGATKYNRDSNAKLYGRDGAFNPVNIRVPAQEGAYEIAYVLNPGQRIISRTPITITRAEASIAGPETVKAGDAFEVSYTGEGFDGDRIVLVPAGTPDDRMWQWGGKYGFFAEPGAHTGTIVPRLTQQPGQYELRYVTGLQNLVLARTDVEITP